MATQNLVIMFTDIKGFTARVSDGSRNDLTDLRRRHEKLLKPVFRHYGGRIVKTIGDAFMVVFNSPTDAVICGVTIQEVLRQYNKDAADAKKLEVRVAINSGEVEDAGDDFFGEPVNIAARLEGIAEAGEVYFTEAVYLSMNRNEAPTAEVGERTFKGIAYPVKIYKTIYEPETEFSNALTRKVKVTENGSIINGKDRVSKDKPGKKLYAVIAGAVLLLTAVIFIFVSNKASRAIEQAREALEKGNPVQALEILKPAIEKLPGDENLLNLAIQAATAQVDLLLQTRGAREAGQWLSNELKIKPFLEPLRNKMPVLEALALGDAILQKRLNDYEEEKQIRDLLARYPNDSQVPYVLAEKLKKKERFHALRLYQAALERGHAADDNIYNYCTELLSIDAPGNLETAHEILRSTYRERAISWAQNIMRTDVSGNHWIYRNAWDILEKVQDPIVYDPYFQNLHRLAYGFGGDDEVDQVLAVFLKQDDPLRKKQLFTLAQKRVTYRSGYMKKVEQVKEALEARWGNP